MEAAGQEVEIPDVGAPFILSYLLEIGPVVSTGFGPAEIGWRDIEAWQHCIGIKIPPWQARLVVNLSKAYLNFSKKAEEPDCLSPFDKDAIQGSRREAISRKLRIGFKAMMISVGPRSGKRKKPK